MGRRFAAILDRRRFDVAAVDAILLKILDDKFPTAIDAQAMNHKLQASVHPYVTIAMIAEQIADGAADVGDLLRRHEIKEFLPDERLPAHATTNENAETRLATTLGVFARDRHHADAIDVRLSAMPFAARERDLELPRQIIQVAPRHEMFGHVLGVGQHIDPPVRADRSPGAGRHIARDVAAPVERSQPRRSYLAQETRQVP